MANENGEKEGRTAASKKLEYHPTVRDLPLDEQPCQLLRHAGPQALSVAELFAIVLRTGTRQDNALELAGKLLAKYGGAGGLRRAVRGVGHRLGEEGAAQGHARGGAVPRGGSATVSAPQGRRQPGDGGDGLSRPSGFSPAFDALLCTTRGSLSTSWAILCGKRCSSLFAHNCCRSSGKLSL